MSACKQPIACIAHILRSMDRGWPMPPAAPAVKNQADLHFRVVYGHVRQVTAYRSHKVSADRCELPRTATLGSPCAAVACCCILFACGSNACSVRRSTAARHVKLTRPCTQSESVCKARKMVPTAAAAHNQACLQMQHLFMSFLREQMSGDPCYTLHTKIKLAVEVATRAICWYNFC